MHIVAIASDLGSVEQFKGVVRVSEGRADGY